MLEIVPLNVKPGLKIDDVLRAFAVIGNLSYIGTFGGKGLADERDQVLVHYARDPETNAPFGTVVAKKVGGVVQIGWSLQERPQFKKSFERQIAIGRATKGTQSAVPSELDDAIEYMVDRAKRYYRVSEFRVAIAGVY